MFIIYALVGCPYSSMALELLERSGVKHQHIIVSDKEKMKYKKKHGMQTFPQIFFEDSKGKRTKIGGFDDMDALIDVCNIIKSQKFDHKRIELFFKVFSEAKDREEFKDLIFIYNILSTKKFKLDLIKNVCYSL